jgi:hypothetical protein
MADSTTTENSVGGYKAPICPVTLSETGNNYASWKPLALVYLTNETDVADILNGKLVRPEVSGTPTEEQKALIKRYDVANQRARMIMFACISPTLISNVFHDETDSIKAKTMWDRLKDRYAKQSGASKQAAISRFSSFKFSSSRSIDQNITDYQLILQKLSDVGVVFPNELKCARLIDSLPSDWNSLKLSWATKEDSQKLLENLIEMLKAEAYRLEMSKHHNNMTAMFTRMQLNHTSSGGRGRNRSHNTRGNRRRADQHRTQDSGSASSCYTCGRTGHYSRNCRSRGNSRGARNSSRGQSRSGGRSSGGSHSNRPQLHLAEANMITADPIEVGDAFNTNDPTSAEESDSFILDSGATHHCVNNRRWFTHVNKVSETRKVQVGSRHKLLVQGHGTILLTLGTGNNRRILELENALFVPRMRKNLVSVSQLTEQGYSVALMNDKCVLKKGKLLVQAKKVDGLYKLCGPTPPTHRPADSLNAMNAYTNELDENIDDPEPTGSGSDSPNENEDEEKPPALDIGSEEEESEKILTAPSASLRRSKAKHFDSKEPVSLFEAHKMMAHINKEALKRLFKLENIEYTDDFSQCETCIRAKQTRSSYRSRPEEGRDHEIGTIYGDLCSTSVPSLGGAKYFMLLTEGFSRYRSVYLLKSKDEAGQSI